jgi:hypothetical protein
MGRRCAAGSALAMLVVERMRTRELRRKRTHGPQDCTAARDHACALPGTAIAMAARREGFAAGH